MKSNDWVAEHVMGFERGYCQGAMGGGNASPGGDCETWFRCDWCGRHIHDGKTPRLHRWGDGHRVGEPTLIEARESGLCPNYPFPKFTLVDLMRKLGEEGLYGEICYTAARYYDFTITLGGRYIHALDPLQALCDYLYSNRDRLFPEMQKEAVFDFGPATFTFEPWLTRNTMPMFFANIRDAIKLLQKAMGQGL